MPDYDFQSHAVTDSAALETLYDKPYGPAIIKETDRITAHYRALIEAAPFVAVATSGPDGLDCSPRGDAPGFVRVHDDNTLLIPDRRGNNRIDSLRNLIADPRISLLFLIPGVGECMRVNGRAIITTDPALRESFAVNGKMPATVIVVTVERAYFQCTKAIVRAKLWDPARHVDRNSLPSTGQIVSALSGGKIDAEAHDRAAPQRVKETLY